MAIREGLRRIRVVGRVLFTAGLGLIALLLFALIVTGIFHDHWWMPSFFAIGFFGIPVSITGGTILLAAWIVEGFAIPRQPPRP